ncbi:MAG TPA: hypothetical protein PKY87_09710 [Terricaulis sp.]|nr:hypothetical protein [Terricaulis sp.]
MLRQTIIALMAALGAALSATAAFAQSPADTLITVDNPATYSQRLADEIARDGVIATAPILTRIYALQAGVADIQLNPQQLAQFTTIQQMIAGRRATVVQQLADIALADTLRSIYYYHYFGRNVWIYTRLDFVRVGETQWALSALLWNSDANALGIEPGALPYRSVE